MSSTPALNNAPPITLRKDKIPVADASPTAAPVPGEQDSVGAHREQPVKFSTWLAKGLPTPEDAGKPEGAADGPAETPAQAQDEAAAAKAAQKAYEKKYRLNNDIGVEILGGDVPGAMAMIANSSLMPTALKPVLGVFNIINSATGFIGIASDLRETYDAQRNPGATQMDKMVDWGHLIIGDIGSTASDLIPIFDSAMQSHPLTSALFMGGQVLGMVMDTAHTIYDVKRGGEQSHIDGEDEKTQAKQAILDNVEKTGGKMFQGMGTLGTEAMAFGWSLGMPSELLTTMTTLGGSVGFVMGVTQVKKAQDLRDKLMEFKEDGKTTIRFPVVTKHGPDVKEMSVDEALQRVNSMQKWGRAQELSSALTMAAAITGVHLVACAAVASGVGLAVIAGGVIIYKLLPKDVQDKIKTTFKPLTDAAHQVAEFAKPVTEPIDKVLGKGVEELSKGMGWVGKEVGQGMTWTTDKLHPLTVKIAPYANKALHVGYVGAEHTLNGMTKSAHAVHEAGAAVRDFSDAHTPALSKAARYVGHKVAAGVGHAVDFTNKALGNTIDEVPEEKPVTAEG